MQKLAENAFAELAAGEYDDYDVDTLVTALRTLDTVYFNDDESWLTDGQYDALRRFVQTLEPTNSYFNKIGSDVRGGKVKLPYELGSLDQVEIGEIGNWVINNVLNIEDCAVTDKLDGMSGLVTYNADGTLAIAYSRGNGVEGADITRHVKHLPDVPAKIDGARSIRGEIIISKTNFPKIQKLIKRRAGGEYKNARNMISGSMNASTLKDTRGYKYIDFVAYDILGETMNKKVMLATLKKLGFKTPSVTYLKGKQLTDKKLAKLLSDRRDATEYEIDGVVIDVVSAAKRALMTTRDDTLNPAYSIKYKVADASNLAVATVKEVEWNISKHGYLKPRVCIFPIELVGVTIKHATGFNAKFINENKIGPGAKVEITRSGDVIPFIQKVVKPAKAAQMPDVAWDWNDTGVDAVATDETDDVTIEQMVSFFASIDAPLLKKGNVEKLFGAGFSTAKIINATSAQLKRVIGANGQKIYDGLRQKLTNIPLYTLMGSTTYFGRGVGRRKFKKLQEAVGFDQLLYNLTARKITAVDGFEEKTALKIINGMGDFDAFMEECGDNITFAADKDTSTGSLVGEKIVFTGFRDKELTALAEDAGATMQSGISSKTTILVAKNPNSTSGKMKKARANNVRILGIDEFKELV